MDQSFTEEAASGGMAEVKLGQLAQKNGSTKVVKDFGKRMVADHSKAGTQLKDVASRNSIAVPFSMNETDQAIYDQLSTLSGTKFHKANAQQMVRKDIAAFKKEATIGSNMDIKQFASQTLPTLEDHLKMARSMEKATSSINEFQPATPATR
jgi:putative membrane protein